MNIVPSILLIAVAISADPQRPQGIRCRVTDVEARPLPGVTATVLDMKGIRLPCTTVSDVAGRFTVPCAGTLLRLSLQGFHTYEGPPPSDATALHWFTLESVPAEPVVLAICDPLGQDTLPTHHVVRIVDAAGTPVRDAVVEAKGYTQGIFVTDSDGLVCISATANHHTRLSIVHPLFLPAFADTCGGLPAELHLRYRP